MNHVGEIGRMMLVEMLPPEVRLKAEEIARAKQSGELMRFLRSFGYTIDTADQLARGICEEIARPCR